NLWNTVQALSRKDKKQKGWMGISRYSIFVFVIQHYLFTNNSFRISSYLASLVQNSNKIFLPVDGIYKEVARQPKNHRMKTSFCDFRRFMFGTLVNRLRRFLDLKRASDARGTCTVCMYTAGLGYEETSNENLYVTF
ncbi:hypothetical protein ACJX0J_031191, partial [Zea mays]